VQLLAAVIPPTVTAEAAETTVATDAATTATTAARAEAASPANQENQDQVEPQKIVLETFPPAGSCAIVPVLIAPLE